MKDYKSQRQDAVERLEEVKKTEIVNENDVCEGSVLNVNIIEANVSSVLIGPDRYFLLLRCGSNTAETEVSKNSNNPSWN